MTSLPITNAFSILHTPMRAVLLFCVLAISAQGSHAVEIGFRGPIHDDIHSATGELFKILIQTGFTIALGYFAVQFGFLNNDDDGHLRGIKFYVGKIALPLLVFNTIASSIFHDMEWSVILACSLAKFTAYGISLVVTLVAKRGQDKCIATAAIFAFFVVSSDDFSVGFPVISALYPKGNLTTYLAINALIVIVAFIPLTWTLLEISGASASASVMSRARSVLANVLGNPVISMTFAGVLWQYCFPPTEVGGMSTINGPANIVSIVDFLTMPFSPLALFLTGSSLGGLRIEAWPGFLALLKVFFCSFGAAGLCKVFLGEGRGSNILVDFSYLYGSISTSSAPLVFASTAGLPPQTQRVLASAIVMGLVLAGPSLIMFSILSTTNLDSLSIALQDTLIVMDYLSIPCLVALILLLLFTKRCFTRPPNDLILGYAVAAGVYLVCKGTIIRTECQSSIAKGSTSMRQRFIASPEYIILPDLEAILFSVAQNSCRMIVLLLVGWRLMSFPRKGTKTALIIAVILACAVGIVTPPNTLNEVCDLPLDILSLGRTTTVVVINFLVLSALMVAELLMGDLRRGEEECLLRHLPDSDIEVMPYATVKCLAIGLGLRLFMEACLCSTILIFGEAAGETVSFQQMLIVEHILEHTQIPLLLFAILLGGDYDTVLHHEGQETLEYLFEPKSLVMERSVSP